ncbi:hypothetical protein [Paraburkholderia hospita]|nr:hypothetical protein [Paraburkholderia hospita]
MHAHNDLLRVALERDGYQYGRRILTIALTIAAIGALIGAAAFGNP